MNRHSNPGYFVPFNVMPYSTEKCHHWAIVTSLNPCTPTPLRPDDVIFLFLDFDVIILDDVNPWAILTSLNPCTPTPLCPDDVIFLFLVYAPTPLRPNDVIFSIYRLRPDDVIIFDDVTYLIYATKII